MVNHEISFPIFQFADNTILVRDGFWDSSWSIKSILRSFELMSDLTVDFQKNINNIVGPNIY